MLWSRDQAHRVLGLACPAADIPLECRLVERMESDPEPATYRGFSSASEPWCACA